MRGKAEISRGENNPERCQSPARTNWRQRSISPRQQTMDTWKRAVTGSASGTNTSAQARLLNRPYRQRYRRNLRQPAVCARLHGRTRAEVVSRSRKNNPTRLNYPSRLASHPSCAGPSKRSEEAIPLTRRENRACHRLARHAHRLKLKLTTRNGPRVTDWCAHLRRHIAIQSTLLRCQTPTQLEEHY